MPSENLDVQTAAASSLSERHQQLELGLAAANMGAWEWDVASGALHCTPICKAHFGFAPDADMHIPQIAARLHPGDIAPLRRAIEHAIDAQVAFQTDCRVCWGDKSTHWIRAAGRLMQPGATRMVGVTLDLTAEHYAAEERADLLAREQAALAEAQQALRLRDEFLSIASHELKTPLTSVLGNAQLLQRRTLREGSLSAAHQRTLGVIVDQSHRLEKLINDLLDISRIEMGHLSLDVEPIDLATLVRQVVEEVQPMLYIQHTVVAELRASPVPIAGDALRLEQVLQNLIQNSIKYSPDGGQITVRLESSGTHAQLSISDQGIGIPSLAVPQLFSRFYRASNVHEQSISGMGIGLYVVKEIVSLHGGTIAVSSQEGSGSTFTIAIPLASERALQAGM
ncbi:MAG TPA: ATP-binding protein [Kouleothrix sp.]|uniref:sensor histidine kinase n=1 Tax=Kouleothrix sp. TaxID=2779161 RepID=UPI002C731839|nr:ATP-binding protein [Kouleothrix sp.]HRC77955.1 ATP-binding protein [Kouleothrix sp.]